MESCDPKECSMRHLESAGAVNTCVVHGVEKSDELFVDKANYKKHSQLRAK